MPEKLIIGLTGPTGAGKSSLRDIFEQLGCVYVDTDILARRVTEKGSSSLARIAKVFGSDILLPDGSLDRRKLASRAFSTKVSTAVLDLLTHPAIIDMSLKIIEDSDKSVAVIDAPLLFEAGMDSLCHAVIAVTADDDVRLHRIMERDGLDEKSAGQRMNAQHSSAWYEERSDHVIRNDSDFSSLEQNAKRIFLKLTEGKK